MIRNKKKVAFTLAEFFSPHSCWQRKIAFTLAEVLITLGIIGVVAAMTVPALVNSTQNMERKTALKKAYSILNQAMEKMYIDEGQIINKENYPNYTFGTKFKTYFTSLACHKSNKICIYPDNSNPEINLHIKEYKTYTLRQDVQSGRLDDGQMILTDGMFIMIENGGHTESILLSIDVNGLYKKPNAWGHDLFTFQIMNDTGKLLPMGAAGTLFENESQYCSINSTNSENGIGCTYKALTDENYFKNLPK